MTFADLQKKLADLITETKQNETVEASAATAINGLVATNAQLAADLKVAIANGDPAAIQAAADAIDAANAEMAASASALAAAIPATPAS